MWRFEVKDHNFLYLVRALVYRTDYGPTYVDAGPVYTENSAVLVFKLNRDIKDPARKYDDLLKWQKMLANPLEVVVD